MNWYFKTIWTATLVASASFMISACGKKSNDIPSNLQGNITVSGQGVTSSSTLGGLPIQLGVTNIQKINNSQSSYMQQSQAQVQFSIALNGQMRNVSLAIGQQSQMSVVQIGDFDVSYDGRCAEYTCDRIALTLFATSRTNQSQIWKEIGVLKIMSTNVIGAAIELQGLLPSLLPVDQMTAQLNRLASQ